MNDIPIHDATSPVLCPMNIYCMNEWVLLKLDTQNSSTSICKYITSDTYQKLVALFQKLLILLTQFYKSKTV